MKKPSILKCFLSSLIIVAILIESSSCCKSLEDLPLNQLPDSKKVWLIYHVGDEVSFKNQHGQLREYTVTEIITEEFDDGGGMVCASYRYQSIRVLFSISNSLQGLFELTAETPDQQAGGYIEWDELHSSIPINEIDEGFKPSTAQYLWKDTLEVNSKFYFNVLQIKSFVPFDSASTYIGTLFYSKPDGVIRFDQMNGIIWERL